MVDFVTVLNFVMLLLLTSFWIWGVHGFFQLTGLSNNFIVIEFYDKTKWELPEWIRKPLFECPPCMSSIHGSLAFFLVGDFNFYLWPVFCFCLCGLNYIIKEHLYE